MEGNYINTGLLIKMDILLRILKKELYIVLWWKLLMIRLIVNLGIHLKLCTKHRVSIMKKMLTILIDERFAMEAMLTMISRYVISSSE